MYIVIVLIPVVQVVWQPRKYERNRRLQQLQVLTCDVHRYCADPSGAGGAAAKKAQMEQPAAAIAGADM